MVSLPVAQAAGMRVCAGTLIHGLHGPLQINRGLGHRVRHHFRGFRLRRRRQRHDRATHRRLADPRVRSLLRLPDRAENILALLGDRKSDVVSQWPNWDHKNYTVEDLAIGQIRFDNGAIISIDSIAEDNCVRSRVT